MPAKWRNVRAVECVWVYEPEAGACRQMEACSGPFAAAYRFPIELASGLFAGSLASSTKNHHIPGTFASSSACYAHCLPRPPSGTDVQSKLPWDLSIKPRQDKVGCGGFIVLSQRGRLCTQVATRESLKMSLVRP